MAVLLLVGFSTTGRTEENAEVAADNLKYSRDFYSKVHFVAVANLDFGAGGKAAFKYDRYPNGGRNEFRLATREGVRTEGWKDKPLLYKEWRFEGAVNGKGLFKAGIIAGTKYVLVLQGRGTSCDTAEDFTHWLLKITGKNADYAFYGEFSAPVPDKQNE